ncbi:MAG: polysulfide reductase NrfD [Deltaproteobacteria bacterium]|nr:polysulfide reductase NrfD [Deltaproteobacteria bacterium]
MKDILQQSTLQLKPNWKMILLAMVGVGLLAFIAGVSTGNAERAWEALLLNTLFWGGIAQAGVMLGVIWQITDAKWGRPFKRVAEGFAAFLPAALVMFLLIILVGNSYLFEWVEHPMEVKKAYLNLPFFISRNIIGFSLMYGISMFFLMASLKPDLMLARSLVPGFGGKMGDRVMALANKLLKNGEQDPAKEAIRLEAFSRKVAPLLGVTYTIVMTMVAVDFVMSLDQEWFSTLFGVYFFVGNIYTTLAMMLIVMYFVRQKPGVAEYVTINRMHDLAKLTFAFAMLWTYMTFAHYLIIWYANVPEETPFMVTRAWADTPWRPVFWTLLGVLFIFPYLGLMSRTVCRTPAATAVVGTILVCGQFMSHYMMVVPSIQDRHEHPTFLMGYPEILVTLGFAGGFFLCFMLYMSTVPILPISDKHLCKSWHGR